MRENPASRGTETSAEVLVGPPWRVESNAGQQTAVVLGIKRKRRTKGNNQLCDRGARGGRGEEGVIRRVLLTVSK